MAVLWVILVLALTGLQLAQGLPVNPTLRVYPHEAGETAFEWSTENSLYAALPALALVLAAVGLLFGCTWCYRHKDCKPNEGADNQLFTASVTHLHHDARRSQPPDSGFSEPVNNNISEDNNNGPISLREMQNIANNNAAAYIVSENEERNRISRDSVVEFEPLPSGIRIVDPLERCADWFAGEDFPRNQLQYLREIGRGWFGRVVEGEIEDEPGTTTVAVKILNQNASLEDKARFLDEARLYRDMNHENILGFVAKCLQEDPWILIFELCSLDLQQYLITNRPKMAILNESGVPLQLMCDVTSALAHMHSRGFLYGCLWSGNVLVRGTDNPRAVIGHYARNEPQHNYQAPEITRNQPAYTTSSDIWSLGSLIWEVCAWGAAPPDAAPPPDLPCPYRNHLYQVMQLCWHAHPSARPTAAQVHALLRHLHESHTSPGSSKDDGYTTTSTNTDFEERWQTLKPNTIPKLDEHVAIVHAPSTSMTSHFTGSDDFDNGHTIQDSLSVEMDTAVSRSSSIMSDRDPLSIQIKSESLTNLHGSLEDVRNIYLTHNETPALECHQGNINLEDKEKEQDRSDSSVDPWLKDIITDSQDDVSYYKDVSDVIKNLDNILNSEKTSSSESSHQASPSRDNLSLECKKDYPMQTSMVKSPGISNFQNILDTGFDSKSETEPCDDDEADRDTVGTLSHSFERHSDSLSQQTLENMTPDTPIKDVDISNNIAKVDIEQKYNELNDSNINNIHSDLPNECRVDSSASDVPKLKELCVASMPSVSNEQVILKQDCQTSYDNKFTDIRTGTDTKSIDISTAFISNEIGYLENEYITPIQSEEQSQEVNSLSKETKLPVEFARIPTEPINSLVSQTNYNENESIGFLNDENVKSRDISQVEVINDISVTREENELVLPNKESTDELETETILEDRVSNVLLDNKQNNSQLKITDIETTISDIESKQTDKSLQSESLLKFEEVPMNMASDVPSLCSFAEESSIKEKVMDDYVITADISESTLKNDSHLINEDKQEAKSLVNHYENDSNEYIKEEPISDKTSVTNEDSMPSEINDLNKPEELNKSHYEEDIQSSCNKSENFADSLKNISVDVSDRQIKDMEVVTNHLENIDATEQPETVQSYIDVSREVSLLDVNIDLQTFEAKPEEVQSSDDNVASISQAESSLVEDVTYRLDEITKSRSDINETGTAQPNDSTVYMDLINDTNSKILKDSSVDDNVKYIIQSCLETSNSEAPCALIKNESTIYLDLPSILKETDDFLHSEKSISSQHVEVKDNIFTSTPKGSDPSHENTLEAEQNIELSETKVPEYIPGASLPKQEHKCVTDNISPFESPSKSHHTDTYDENSSVVLGPFENCSLELFKTVKSVPELADLPKEELLAFSSNFSEMNLETPSPLRDGNFLNEVPDIVPDELHFDEIASISEAKPESQTPVNTDETEEQSSTEKRVSPLTPPNSPGNFLASTSQQKYVVDIDIGSDSKQEIVDLNQIDLQMTTKLAMADNENNMNIEYSGPLTEEGITLDDSMLRDNDAIPESYLAGNGGSVEDVGEDLVIDEERMKELRNELELKLPLAQVAGIEPALPAEGDWSELPPPPELILTYGALSPIAEETRMQLNAYENDDQWNISVRTESSASYPEPCNNSTDEVTDLPTGANTAHPHSNSTYTIQSKENSINHTYTVQKEGISSKEITMSADSLNASPLKKLQEIQSPIDDKTYIKNDEDKESNCERLSQVSPFLLSPTTETSAPEISDNAIGVSTLSKTTVPTDAKSSKPSETQCLSKATSIDSWCSNDTLYNVEENFDDLAMDPDCPMDFEEKDKSESDDTLTHNDDEKELSHCSTYIIHDSKSEVCETFSPDSITANDNYTYTKLKTDVVTPSIVTKSDLNDSTKSQTKDLAYGTLMSGLPSYSNCTTELASGMEDAWKLPLPELVRRSPVGDECNFTPPKQLENKETIAIESPQTVEPRIKKMESVDISCLKDNSGDMTKSYSDSPIAVEVNDSQNLHFRNMAHSVTSTPLLSVQDGDNAEAIPLDLPQTKGDTSDCIANNVPNFQMFFQSAEIRPQDISSNVSNEASTEILLEGESKTLSREHTTDISAIQTPTYSDFESSAVTKPQDIHSKEKSSQSVESGTSSEDFRNFESSVKNRPQDLSSLIDASSLLLKSERWSSELLMGITNSELESTSQLDSHAVSQPESLIFSPNIRNLFESQTVFYSDLDREEETEQPHSIIITESPLTANKVSPNRTFDSHTKANRADVNSTYDSHASGYQPKNVWQTDSSNAEKINGHSKEEDLILDFLEKENREDCANSVLEGAPVEHEVSMQVDKDSKEPVAKEPETKFPNTICNGTNELFATVNFLNETFEELVESNVDDNDTGVTDLKDEQIVNSEKSMETESESIKDIEETSKSQGETTDISDVNLAQEEKQMASVTDDFLQNEKKFCQLDSYFPLLSDIRFTGPATEIMTTSFTQDSPTDPTSPECEQDSKPDPTADILKEWDSDSDSHSTNSSSGEFIWKQRDSGSQPSGTDDCAGEGDAPSGSGDSASGSEGDEAEFVPSSWDCRAAPSKSSLRSMEQPQDNKKRVVFKRQKYHCVYEYPREAPDPDADSPAYLPDFSTYSEWDPSSAEEAELGYGQLFGAPNPLDLFPLRAGIAFGADYDEDFFISSSARPFESLGVMSTTSQFFPGMHIKPSLERDFPDEISEDFPPPPSPLPTPTPTPTPTLAQTRTPSLDFTTPDSGVEDITPGSITDDDYKKKLLDSDTTSWRSIDSASSSESVSPSSPGGEALGGLRHTRDKLKLDLPPSPHIPSPRHNRVFNFVLDKPKRREEKEVTNTPLVMTDETPIITMSLSTTKEAEDIMPEPTFSTFGKSAHAKPSQSTEPEKNIILTDDVQDSVETEVKEENPKVEPVKGEGTVLDSGDEDSGIESSSKATLERKPASNIS